MTARFEMGEVARLVPHEKSLAWGPCALDPYFDTDVTIDSAPIHSEDYCDGIGYFFVTCDGRRMDAGVRCFRKRRPPQDWVKLCRLDERPVEELA